ncbi:MAG: hypothetical protein PHQ60_00915 [Sideroxydans sp.]|nr:hypothetical protein [Sideroxydans sp.]
MNHKDYRNLALRCYENYETGKTFRKEFLIRNYPNGIKKEDLQEIIGPRVIYVLRLSALNEDSISAIPNCKDEQSILYIGGHASGKNTERYNIMIAACRKAKKSFDDSAKVNEERFALNDQNNGHAVANNFTTGLLRLGFSIEDCSLDIVDGKNECDELELLIGYQEKFHRLPPWNRQRGGSSVTHSPP